MTKHLKQHQLSFSTYAAKYMTRGEGILKPTIILENTPVEIEAEQETVITQSSPVTKITMSHTTLTDLRRLATASPTPPPTTTHQPEVELIELDSDPVQELDIPPVKIQCAVCSKTFRMNKQLLAHMKKHLNNI